MNYKVVACHMAFYYGHIFMVHFLENTTNLRPLGLLALNMYQKVWPCTKKWIWCILWIHVHKGKFWGVSAFYLSPCFLLPFLLLPPSFPLVYNNIRKLEKENTRQAKKRKWLSKIETTILFHGPLTFTTKEPHTPLPPQIMLDMTMNDVGLKVNLFETSNSLVTLTFIFPYIRAKWLWDEFNGQSHV